LRQDAIVLKNAKRPGEEPGDLHIPLTEKARMLINWPPKKYETSFPHVTYYYLVHHDKLEEDLLFNLRGMEEAGYLAYHDPDMTASYDTAQSIRSEILAGADPSAVDEHRRARAVFFEEVGKLLEGDAEENIIADIDAVLASEAYSEEEKEDMRAIRDEVGLYFGASRGLYEDLMEIRGVLRGVYVPLLTPTVSVFLTFAALSAVKFLRTAGEKRYIRNAFAHCPSTDVINDLLSDPEKLTLGGEQKYLTALFTDVKGFSSISEALDPTQLVRLLNTYLSEMSDIILAVRGTIDKYEGDAIISFFGAPVEYPDHARRACLSAVRIKRLEQSLNRSILDHQMSPAPLLTWIGINTGPMVVGNMGTEAKMDYTIMGSSVSLASGLEGVNKQYGTWVLISEATRNEAGEDFTYRRLDRVRVVGIDTPVRLFELVEEKESTDKRQEELIRVFHDGLDYFENREWSRALQTFKQVTKMNPGDGPAGVFASRCGEYMRKPRPPTGTASSG